MERMGKKSADNLINAIKKSRDITLGKFIFALGIRHAGEEMALDLSEKLGDLNRFKNISQEELEAINGIGPKVAASIYEYFHNKEDLKLVDDLLKAGVSIKNIESKNKAPKKLAGLSFVLTGTLQHLSRDKAKQKIRALGGNISSAVSKSTAYLIAGENTGSKFDKAKKLGVKIIEEEEFLKMIEL